MEAVASLKTVHVKFYCPWNRAVEGIKETKLIINEALPLSVEVSRTSQNALRITEEHQKTDSVNKNKEPEITNKSSG